VFSRILIANRGEIAIRVMRTCREMGIRTVAIYSDADAGARHVLEADEAVRVGPAPPAESYLHADRVIDAARASGAEAIHPGYGFLSENAAFAAACADAGLVFIGPSPDAMRAMGSKIAARRLMTSAGVPVVPGEAPADQSVAALAAAVERVGRPALVKPSAGGGGIGMRVVRTGDDVEPVLLAARRDAEHAFGDGTLYVERLVERPRHVEIQIFADAHDGCVSLFERECSIQRRHQKVIEESPSPVMTPELRAQMGAAAVAAARAVGYQNAGTVEFLVDDGAESEFFFLEMNTRLQVEHPVTELVTGVDLVRAQLAVAAGQPLPFRAERLAQRGHAIELRVYAEDPANGFLPQAGPLLVYREPRGPGVRVDSGVAEGDEVSVHYDPLLAKLVVHAETRQAALARADRALGDFAVLGIVTNLALLRALVRDPDVRAGRLDTGLLDRRLPHLLAEPAALPPAVAAVAAARAAFGGTDALATTHDPWTTLPGWRS
jgi:acetyl-CoA/propionyl-CoA carboxylase, biotin carboxylase, biotin carboxyl carrier protein